MRLRALGVCYALGNLSNQCCVVAACHVFFVPELTVTALRVIEDRFGFVVIDALVTCTVGCGDFACDFENFRVVAYGQSILRLSIRFPLVTCDPELDIFVPTLHWVVKVDYAGLKNVCDAGDQFEDDCTAATAVFVEGSSLNIRCQLGQIPGKGMVRLCHQ